MHVYKNISATLISLAGDIKQASGHSIETPIPSSVFNRSSGIQAASTTTTINLVYIHFACFCHNSQQECTSILGMINKTNPRYIYFLIHVSRVSVFLFVFCRISQQQQPIMVHVSIPKLEKMKIVKSEGCTKKYTSYSSQLIKK